MRQYLYERSQRYSRLLGLSLEEVGQLVKDSIRALFQE